MCGKHFSIYGDHIPRNALNLYIFIHAPVPHSKLQISLPQDERSGKNYDLLYQNSIRKSEDELEH